MSESMYQPLVYDIEIKKAILGRGETYVEGIEYCAGWEDHANMGVAYLCAYDYVEDRYRVWDEPGLQDFAALCTQRYPLVGFNNVAFDNRVLACAGVTLDPADCYDLLTETWAAAGVEGAFNWRTHGGYGLDAMAYATFRAHKTGNGALAPVWYQQGCHARVIDYCLNDVRLTKTLFDLVTEGAPLISPHNGKALQLQPPPMPFR